MANQYNNKVVLTNEQGNVSEVLMDISCDTATAGDVLAGRTMHLASGAPATGTYQPGDEIEARLKATVGHSCKNLFEITGTTTTNGEVTFTVNKTAGTVVATNADAAVSSRGFIIGTFTFKPGKKYNLSGCPSGGGSSSYRLYPQGLGSEYYDNGSGAVIEVNEEITSNIRCIIYSANTKATVTFRPMICDSSISDDTFEPYVTPTDDRIVSLEARVAALEAAMNNS